MAVTAACADAPRPAAGAAAPRAEQVRGDTLSLAERRAIPAALAFVSERGGNPDVYLVRPDGTGERRLTTAASGDYPAAVSPDGAALLVLSASPDSSARRERLLLLSLADGRPRPLAPVAAYVRNPSWAPDGRWVVFESSAANFRDLYRVNRDGTGLRRLTRNDEGNFEPSVSPDGSRIAFVSSRDDNSEIYVMRADGTQVRRITAFEPDDWSPRWSPDGQTLAFLSSRGGSDRVYLVGADGTRQRRLGGAVGDERERTAAALPGLGEADPAWSPDGRRIALTVRLTKGRSMVQVVEVASGRRTTVTDSARVNEMPAWSPDGRYLAYAAGAGNEVDLYLVRADGTARARITRARGPDWLPRWVPAARR